MFADLNKTKLCITDLTATSIDRVAIPAHLHAVTLTKRSDLGQVTVCFVIQGFKSADSLKKKGPPKLGFLQRSWGDVHKS